MPATDQLSSKDFAARVRQKYPGAYDDLSDSMLVDKIIAKYPQYKDMVQAGSQQPSMSAGTKTFEEAHPPEQQGKLKRFAAGAGIPTNADEFVNTAQGMVAPQADPDEKDKLLRVEEQIPLIGGDFRARADLAKRGDNIAASVPFYGPAERAMEGRVKAGDYAGGLGAGLNAFLSLVGLKSAFTRPGAPPKFTLAGEDVPVKTAAKLPADAAKTASKLTFASGGKADVAQSLEHSLDDLHRQVAKTGTPPKTLKEFSELVGKTERDLNTRFDVALQTVAGDEIVPDKVANALRSKADSMSTSVEGKAAAAEIRQMLPDYGRPRTIRDLNAERMERNALAESFYNKGLGGQISAEQRAAAAGVHKLIADTLRDIIYDDVLEKQFKDGGFRDLKQRQASLINIKETLAKELPSVHSEQLAEQGKPLRSKVTLTASAHPGGSVLTPRAQGLGKMFPRWLGPEVSADAAIRSAFKGSSKAKLLRQAAIARARGNGAVADIIERKAQAGPVERAKAIVREIERPQEATHEQVIHSHVEPDDEMARRGAAGETPKVEVDEKTRAKVSDFAKQARNRVRKPSGASQEAEGAPAESSEAAGGSGSTAGAASDTADFAQAQKNLPKGTLSEWLREAQRLKEERGK